MNFAFQKMFGFDYLSTLDVMKIPHSPVSTCLE